MLAIVLPKDIELQYRSKNLIAIALSKYFHYVISKLLIDVHSNIANSKNVCTQFSDIGKQQFWHFAILFNKRFFCDQTTITDGRLIDSLMTGQTIT